MKHALVEGQRRDAQPGFLGTCPFCGAAMIPKCGEIRVPHWAHRGKLDCDPWWESETEWHRSWKNRFPKEWQESIQWSDGGEKHIADVKTDYGWVIEFQHSYLCPKERRARQEFYRKMIWVVDGLRRKRDLESFKKALRQGARINCPIWTFEVFTDGCAILREWSESRVPTVFDFGDAILWRLDPASSRGMAYVSPIRRKDFVEGLRTGRRYKAIPSAAVKFVFRSAVVKIASPPRRPPWTRGFKQYQERKRRARARIRM